MGGVAVVLIGKSDKPQEGRRKYFSVGIEKGTLGASPRRIKFPHILLLPLFPSLVDLL